MFRAVTTSVMLTLAVSLIPGGCPDGALDLGDPNNLWADGDSNVPWSSFGEPNDSWDPFSDPNLFVDVIDPNDLPEPNQPADPNNGAAEPQDGALAEFDQVWTDFDQAYSYFSYKGIDWDALKEEYRPNFTTDLSADEFADQIAQMLAELHDFHVSVQKPDESYAEVYTREIGHNYTSTPRNRYRVSEYQTLGDNVVWHAWFENNIAYIRVDTFDHGSFAAITEQDVEAIFATYADAAGLIFDIRANSGGDENKAAMFTSHFTDEARTYGYTRTRNGPGHDDFDALVSKTLAPSGGTLFLKPVACLIGERCMSSAEWCTLMMRACPNVTLIGDTTRGSSGNPKGFSLPNGVSYTVPTWIAYTDEQIEIEDRGIAPDIAIEPDQSIDGEHDYVIERAIAELTK